MEFRVESSELRVTSFPQSVERESSPSTNSGDKLVMVSLSNRFAFREGFPKYREVEENRICYM